jgi:hypothetical protein
LWYIRGGGGHHFDGLISAFDIINQQSPIKTLPTTTHQHQQFFLFFTNTTNTTKMQFTTTVLAAVLSATAMAAPAATLQSRTPQWAIENLSRVCNSSFTFCEWSFGINGTPCTLDVAGTNADEAVAGGPATCGPYTVTSGWSGQFGAGNGFTVLAVKNTGANLISFPSYTDAQLAGGAVVPTHSWATQPIN